MAKKSFISGAIILMLAGFVVRILGFVYRIYLSNLIGSEGMGLFQLIFPIYSLIILTLTSGVSIAVSKMVAEEQAKNHLINLRRITKVAAILVIVLGIIVSVFILVFVNFIANVILKDSRTYYSLILLVPTIPVIAAASALKGYFYGVQEVVPTAVSQIMEQIVRIGLVIALAGYFTGAGLEFACALATVGMVMGEISNLSVLMFVYFRRGKKNNFINPVSKFGFTRKRVILKDILKISIPVSFNRFITSIMSAIESILIPRRFVAGGMNYHSSMEEFGKLSGMAMPIIFFPSLVTSSIATTLVPAISEAASLKNFKTVNLRISKSIQITFILGFIFTAIFLDYSNEIGNLIYKKEKIGDIFYYLSFTSIFLYLQQTLLGVLNGLGKQGISLRNSIIGYSIRIAFVYFCIPLYGIKGYVTGYVISSACVCVLNLFSVVKTTGMVIDIRNWILKPGLIGILLIFTGREVYSFFSFFKVGSNWNTLLAIIGDIIIAISLLVVFGVLKRDDILKMTGVKKNRKRKKF